MAIEYTEERHVQLDSLLPSSGIRQNHIWSLHSSSMRWHFLLETAILCSSTWASINKSLIDSLKQQITSKITMYACWLSATMFWHIRICFKVTELVKVPPQEPTEQWKKHYYITKISLYYWAIIMFGSTSSEINTSVFSPSGTISNYKST